MHHLVIPAQMHLPFLTIGRCGWSQQTLSVHPLLPVGDELCWRNHRIWVESRARYLRDLDAAASQQVYDTTSYWGIRPDHEVGGTASISTPHPRIAACSPSAAKAAPPKSFYARILSFFRSFVTSFHVKMCFLPLLAPNRNVTEIVRK